MKCFDCSCMIIVIIILTLVILAGIILYLVFGDAIICSLKLWSIGLLSPLDVVWTPPESWRAC